MKDALVTDMIFGKPCGIVLTSPEGEAVRQRATIDQNDVWTLLQMVRRGANKRVSPPVPNSRERQEIMAERAGFEPAVHL
jgi:hypothetical protein